MLKCFQRKDKKGRKEKSSKRIDAQEVDKKCPRK